jgi:hypothetical protein
MRLLIAILALFVMALPAQAASDREMRKVAIKNCIKITGKTVKVLGPECWSRYGRKGGAHILNGSGGVNAFTAAAFANSLNRRGVTVVVGYRCNSSCAIIWNLAKRKCWAGNTPPTFRQHAKINSGERVNVHSKSSQYWIKLGKRAGRIDGDPIQQDEMTEWTLPASMKCSNRVMNMASTDGREMAAKHKRQGDFNLGVKRQNNFGVSGRFHGSYGRRTPGMFK